MVKASENLANMKEFKFRIVLILYDLNYCCCCLMWSMFDLFRQLYMATYGVPHVELSIR